jgi:hypothetical protein
MRTILSLASCSFIGLAALCATDGAAADDGMRCGSRLVSKGDTLYAVRSVCGEPDATDRRVVTRTEVRRVQAPCFRDERGAVKCERATAVQVDVIVDEWTYDFGTQRFVRLLTFENGRLLNVATGGYGYKTAAD